MQFPPWLQKGDKIILLATSGKIDAELTKKAAKNLEEQGYAVEVLQTAVSSHNYFSGSPEQRLNDLQYAISNPYCKAILCVRGGYGAIQLLDKLDWDNFKKHPKWLIGFSDITLLHAAIQKAGFASIHGAMAKDFAKRNDDAEKVLQYIEGGPTEVSWKVSSMNTKTIEGDLIGGNLTLLTSLIGSEWEPDWKGKILFIEDIGEYLYKIDRMLWTLKNRGVFKQVAGVVFGHFSDISDTKVPYGVPLPQMIKDFFKGYGFPVVTGFPAGHESPNIPLLLGCRVKLNINQKSSTLTYKL